MEFFCVNEEFSHFLHLNFINHLYFCFMNYSFIKAN